MLSATVLFGATAGCSSGSTPASPAAATTGRTPGGASPIAAGDAPLRVEMIGEAIAALETQLAGPQRFFEVNASPTIVNLFVAVDGATRAVAYIYAAGALGAPAAAQPAAGPTFSAADADFDETLILAQLRDQLPNSDFRLFSITGLAKGGVQYRAVVESSQGGEFVVLLGRDGAILGTDADLGMGQS